MKKEVILAITIGFGLGLIITYGIWLANKSLKSLPQTTTQTEPTLVPTIANSTSSTPSPTQAANTSGTLAINITTPTDEWITDKETAKVEGTTQPNAIVALTYEGSEQIITANNSGAFSTEIRLDGGYNIITATAYDKAGNNASTMITVTYTTSKI